MPKRHTATVSPIRKPKSYEWIRVGISPGYCQLDVDPVEIAAVKREGKQQDCRELILRSGEHLQIHSQPSDNIMAAIYAAKGE